MFKVQVKPAAAERTPDTDGENEHRPMRANISCPQDEEKGPTRQEAASFTFERWLTSTAVVNGSVVAAGWCPPMLEHTNGFSSDGTSVVVGSRYLLLMSVRFPNYVLLDVAIEETSCHFFFVLGCISCTRTQSRKTCPTEVWSLPFIPA